MIDLQIEQAISLSRAAKLPQLRRNGLHPHLASVHRWCSRGSRGIVLESVVVAGVRCTTSDAVDRWIMALTAQANGHPLEQVKQQRTPARRQREHDRAEKELAAAGW